MPNIPRGMVSFAYWYSSSTFFWIRSSDLCLEFSSPQVRIFQLDLVDHVHAEVQVHGFVTQDVLVLFGCPGHFVLPVQREDLRKADLKEQTFMMQANTMRLRSSWWAGLVITSPGYLLGFWVFCSAHFLF